MTLRSNTLLVALLTGSLIGVVACGDDDDSTTSTSTTTTTTSANGGGGTGGSGGDASGGGGEGGGGVDCMQACTDLFQCGLEDDGMGMQLCVNFDDGSGGAGGGAMGIGESDFVMGCIPTCESTPALASIIDPNNCSGTISTIKGASPDEFGPSCDGM